MRAICVASILGVAFVCACDGAAPPKSTADSAFGSKADLTEVNTIILRSDGNYDVTCKDGTHEVDSLGQVQSGHVCLPHPSSDPFDPASCPGPPMSRAEAISRLRAGATDSGVIGSYLLHSRRRDCSTLSGCSEWQAAAASHTFDSPFVGREAVPLLGACFATRCQEQWTFLPQSGTLRIASSGNDVSLLLEGSITNPFSAGYIGTCPFGELGATYCLFRQQPVGFYQRFDISLGGTPEQTFPSNSPQLRPIGITATSSCIRLVMTGTIGSMDPSLHTELETVFLGSFTAP
jgi:hypothetical protein